MYGGHLGGLKPDAKDSAGSMIILQNYKKSVNDVKPKP